MSISRDTIVGINKFSFSWSLCRSGWNIFECKFTEVGWEDEQELSNTEVAKQMWTELVTLMQWFSWWLVNHRRTCVFRYYHWPNHDSGTFTWLMIVISCGTNRDFGIWISCIKRWWCSVVEMCRYISWLSLESPCLLSSL